MKEEKERERERERERENWDRLIMRIDYGRKSVMTRPFDARAYFPSSSNLDESTIVAQIFRTN